MKNTFTLKITLLFLAIFIIANNILFIPSNILSWDVFGYYLYLPLKFIYNDLGLKDINVINQIINKYHSTATFYQGLQLPNGNYVMKYSMGLSFFYAPFFFIGHLFSKLLNYPLDGFSAPYQYSILFGGMLYSFIGIWTLSKILKSLFSNQISIFVLILIVFSTNYIIHNTMYGQNAMSHNYLFTAYTLIIWWSMKWTEEFKTKYLILLAIICGLTILSRPSEIVCLIIPALWSLKNNTTLKQGLTNLWAYKKSILLFIAILAFFGSFQAIYWKIYTGKFLFYSYGANAGEGFEFLNPFIWEVLFSFRKGWFVYTPIMLFSVAGFYIMYKKQVPIFFALFAYFLINMYLVSSWSCWWYAQSFSQRSLIQSYPIMAIPLGYFITWLTNQKILKWIVLPMILACVVLNIFQTIQYHKGVLDGDRMTKAYYMKTFGKLIATDDDRKLLLIKRSFDGVETFDEPNEYRSKILSKLDFETHEKKDSSMFYAGKYAFKIDSSTQFSPSIETPYTNITKNDHAFIKVTAYIYPTADVKNNPFSLVIHFTHNHFAYKYITFDSDKMNIEPNKWNKISFMYLTPEVRNKKDDFKTYFWNRGKQTVFIDDFQVEIYEKK